MFESRISAGATEKLPGWEEPHEKTVARVLRHGRTCSKMRCAILWIGQTRKWSNCTKFQALAWMIINASRKNSNQLESCQKFADKLSLNPLYLARNGRPDILWSVNKPARSVRIWTHSCDKRLARLISLNPSHERFPTALPCGKYSTALQTGFVSRRRLCWRPWGLMYLSKPNICPSQLVVQENKLLSSTGPESETISLDAGLRMDRLPALDLWDRVIEVLRSTNNTVPTQP